MKRFYGVLLAAALVVTSGVFVGSAHAQSGTNNFRISSFDIQYELSRDSEGRSVLKTTEKIIAEFPEYDQNHGIERAIPHSYNGHTTDLKVDAVSDESGNARHYETYTSGDTSTLRIGDADTYVHGTQVYEIVYTLHDVTRFYEDTGRDEWYWDINGTQWRVPIDALTVSVKMDDALKKSVIGNPACYQGAEGSTDTCVITEKDGTYTTSVFGLSAGQNVTVAFGFPKGTFEPYQMSLFALLALTWMIFQFISIPLAFALIIIFGVILYRRVYRVREENPIATEYTPPRDASVIVSAQVLGSVYSVFSAQLIDLAVRHYIAIVQTKEGGFWTGNEYDIVIQSDLSELKEEEKEILSDMFDGLPKVGDRLALKTLRSNMSYSSRTLDNDKKLKVLLENVYELRAKSKNASKLFYGWAIALLILAILTLSIAIGVAALTIWLYGLFLKPLTDKGLALRRYGLGLKRYIKASEVERLKFLQGPDTADKIGYNVDPSNPGELVKLYERVLPYAILFGYEKQWAKQLGDIYAQTQKNPDWYTGSAPFNAAVFATTLGSFSAAATTYSGTSSSSSSGGSGGGGSSGGGGGGGGGGGW